MPDQDDWSLKEYAEGCQRWFFRKNLAPSIPPRHRDYGFIAYLTFAYTPRDESGLPFFDDEEILYKLEDVELDTLEAGGLAVQVAAATKNGIKDFLFYTRDPQQFLARAERFRTQYPQFKVGCEIVPDSQWSHYEEFP